MAVYTLDKWENVNREKTVGEGSKAVSYKLGEELSGGSNSLVTFETLKIKNLPEASSTISKYQGAVRLGIYQEGTGSTYAFGSTIGTDAPATVNNWKLIASGTGSTGTLDAGEGIPVKGITLNMASGSGKILGLNYQPDGSKGDNGIVAVNGSSDVDSVLIYSSGVSSTAVLNFGSGDNIYFSGTSNLGQISGAGTNLLSSVDGQSVGGQVLLKSAISTSVAVDGSTGNKLDIKFVGSKAHTLELTSASGVVNITGATGTDKVTLEDIVSGKTSIGLGDGNDTFEGSTLTGGNLTVTGGNNDDSISIKAIAGSAVTLSDFGTGKDVAKIDTVSSGSLTVVVAGTNDSLTAAITESGKATFSTSTGTVVGGSGTVLKEAKLGNGSNTLNLGGKNAMSIVASSAAGTVTFNGDGADLINIKSVGASSKISVAAGTSADTVSIASIGASANVTIGDGATNSLVLSSGSSFGNVAVSSSAGGVSFLGSDSKVSLATATIKGSANIGGSSKDDYFEFKSLASENKLTLTGGSGNDGYYFGSDVVGKATITDFGWSTSSEEAKDSGLGQDVIFVKDLESATLGKIQLVGDYVQIGGSNIVANASPENGYVYAKIAATGTDTSNAQTFRISSSGARAVGSDSSNTVNGTTGSDGTVTFNAATAEHAYMNAGSNDAVVKNMTAYNGNNDRTASIIDTAIDLDNMTQTTDSSGNVVLAGTDSDPTVTIEKLGTGKAIKVGGKTESDQTAVVLGAASGTTTVESAVGDEALKTAYIGDSTAGSVFDFSQTDKTTIDLSGKSTVDGATYKNVKGVKGSDNGSSLLVSGSNAVTLEAAGKSDTLSGAGAGADTLVSASGKATNFLLSSGNGNDVVSGFSFGTGANDDKVLISDTGFGEFADAETLVSASNGRIRVGNDNGTLVINASGRDTVAVQFNFGGSNPGTLMLDTSDNGAVLNFASGSNIIMGQSGVTTVKAAAGDTVEAKDASVPAGIGWNSNYIVSSVGVVDVSASDMTAVNGQKNSSDMVVAATGTSLEGPIWVCGGIGANFSDTGNDTLVASGNGNNEIFVGAKMGNDIIQKVSSKDKITFIDTKVSDFGGIDKVLTIDTTGNSFTAVFAGTAGTSTTIKGTTQLAMDKTTNLTFHFDDADYVWDGKTLTEATA